MAQSLGAVILCLYPVNKGRGIGVHYLDHDPWAAPGNKRFAYQAALSSGVEILRDYRTTPDSQHGLRRGGLIWLLR